MTWIKCGSIYINLDLVREIVDQGVVVSLTYSDLDERRIEAADAGALRAWLAEQAVPSAPDEIDRYF